MNIPKQLRDRIDEVAQYVGDTTSDYLIVKRQLINNFPTPERARFSARHPCTKKHILNDFDHAIIAYWEGTTGVRLVIEPEKLHNPGWEHRKKGWALSLLNEQRKQRRNEQREERQGSQGVHRSDDKGRGRKQ